MEQSLLKFLQNSPELKEINPSEPALRRLAQSLEEDYLSDFLSTVILESEEILAIDPSRTRKEILQQAAENIVHDLGAEAATIRLFERLSLRMINFGAYGFQDEERMAAIPASDSIAGKVVEGKKSIAVPSILKDKLYKNKEIVQTKGYNSLLAVPLLIPSFISTENDLLGSLQIYYRTDDRTFNQLEIMRAEMLARRVSYVLAKKKILDLYALNKRKEKIVDHIFVKLSNRQGIKLKDIFIMLIQELGQLLQLQGCSLFSVTDDQKRIYLEAAHPLEMTYHERGHTFTAKNHPYFKTVINSNGEYTDNEYERITENYLLIKDPIQSSQTSAGLKEFVKQHQIYSILFIPIKVNAAVRHILAIYATENKQFFTQDEIELFTFFGKEIMKAAKLEFLGETLHDFKNPAVAVAGLSARCRKLLNQKDITTVQDKLTVYLDMIVQEAARLQDIALTQTGEGREDEIDLGQVARRRFDLNRAVIQEGRLAHITVKQPKTEGNLVVKCPIFGLERVIDNLLNNATKAIPESGGQLWMHCFQQDDMAVLELVNTGAIDPEQLEKIKAGTSKGRGLHTIFRFIIANHGKVDIRSESNQTRIQISLPLA